MYRFVIEHPRWIPAEDLKKLDVRAGAAMGRIYRIRPADKPLRKVPRLDKADYADLAAAIETPNGTVRDLASQMLDWTSDFPEASEGLSEKAFPVLRRIASESRCPEARSQALCRLDNWGVLHALDLKAALADPHPS